MKRTLLLSTLLFLQLELYAQEKMAYYDNGNLKTKGKIVDGLQEGS